MEETSIETIEPIVIMHTWIDGIEKEKDALQAKIESLSKFTSTDKYSVLDQEAKLLLQAQLSAMINYSQLLTLRILTNVQGDTNESKPNPIE